MTPPTPARGCPSADPKQQDLETHRRWSAPETEDPIQQVLDWAANPVGEAACKSPSRTACPQSYGCWPLWSSGTKSFGRVLLRQRPKERSRIWTHAAVTR